MRAGDSYKIRTMAETGEPTEAILDRFKYDYPETEIMKFIPQPAKKRVSKPKVKQDPLG